MFKCKYVIVTEEFETIGQLPIPKGTIGKVLSSEPNKKYTYIEATIDGDLIPFPAPNEYLNEYKASK